MNKYPFLFIVSVSIVFLLIGLVAGYSLTPEYQQNMYVKNDMGLGTADRWLDQRYIDTMIAHHRGAILLAEQAEKNGDRPEIVSLAKEIQVSEPKLIADLYAWKKNWYGNTRKVKDPLVARLGSNDKTFDLRFLNALIAHHEAGILMTKEVRLKSSRNEVLDNADAVENFLTKGVGMLNGWRNNWYSI